MRKAIHIILIAIFFAIPGGLFSQVTITGPTCVVAGTVYQYTINGSWDSTSTMQVCVTGGSIADKSISGSCTPQSAPLGAIQVVWSDGGTGSLALTSTKGNTFLQVQLTNALQPGMLDENTKFQMIDSGGAAPTIRCSLPAGGSCNPTYRYQWQKSYNAVAWMDIPGAGSQNLDLAAGPDQATYYRRKTTEAVSGTIIFSEPALVGLNPRNN